MLGACVCGNELVHFYPKFIQSGTKARQAKDGELDTWWVYTEVDRVYTGGYSVSEGVQLRDIVPIRGTVVADCYSTMVIGIVLATRFRLWGVGGQGG